MVGDYGFCKEVILFGFGEVELGGGLADLIEGVLFSKGGQGAFEHTHGASFWLRSTFVRRRYFRRSFRARLMF